MSGDLQSMRQRVSAADSVRPQRRGLPDRFQRRVEEAAKRRAAAEAAAAQAALEQQRIDAQARRDQMQHKYGLSSTAQRAAYAADAAANQYQYESRLTDKQQKGQRQRDLLQDRFDTARARQQAREQEIRDFRQFGFSQQEDATQFQNQMQRDAVQQGYTVDRDKLQNRATLERDAMQFGYNTLRNDQDQKNTLQRDSLQNMFRTAEDVRQQQFTLERDDLRNEFEVQADERQQQYNQQNLYQREAADISAKWMDQVNQARNAGLEFSPRQQKEMQELDAAFRKNVMNGPYDNGLKQQAMVEYQKKLAAIIPEEKVRVPQQTFEQSIVRDQETGQRFMTIRDPKGFERFEPLDVGQEAQAQNKQAEALMKHQQQQQEKIQKANFERLDKFRDVVNEVRMETDADANAIYKDEESVMREAMKRFQPYENAYRNDYGLQPLQPYQEAEAKNAGNPQQTQRVNPYKRQQPGMADSLASRGGYDPIAQGQAPAQSQAPKLPPISHIEPLPKQVAEKLRTIPDGGPLVWIREKHSSNSVLDQTIRQSADIVINSMLTGDMSDPDLREAAENLRRAGLKIGPK